MLRFKRVSESDQEELPSSVKHVFVLFVATLFGYVTIYGGCQMVRRKGGPWNLTYAIGSNGVPELRIEHPKVLGPSPVIVSFPGEKPTRTDLPITAVFSVPITNAMPFGPVIFVDNTLLPGTVCVNCFGHVVELVPRTLFIDMQDVGWAPGTNIVLSTTNKPDPSRIQVKGQQWKAK